MAERERHFRQAFNFSGCLLQRSWRVLGEMRDEPRAIRVELTRRRIEFALFHAGYTFLYKRTNRRCHCVRSGIAKLGDLMMRETAVFVPKNRHPLANNWIMMTIALVLNVTLVFCRKFTMIHGRSLRYME